MRANTQFAVAQSGSLRRRRVWRLRPIRQTVLLQQPWRFCFVSFILQQEVFCAARQNFDVSESMALWGAPAVLTPQCLKITPL
jgi:hypothetical protein